MKSLLQNLLAGLIVIAVLVALSCMLAMVGWAIGLPAGRAGIGAFFLLLFFLSLTIIIQEYQRKK